MLHAPIRAAHKPALVGRLLVAIALTSALVILAWDAQAFLAAAVKAIRYPFELDYGEGIVWQQAEQIGNGTAYGSITGFPAIVFHYPPLYHALALGVSRACGLDMLAAGRIVSFAATLLTAVFAGLIAAHTVGERVGRRAALLCGSTAALVVLCLSPVTAWGALMRVDMVAMALGLAGVWCGMQALARPRFVHAAALCFVAAVYTKQTAIAAPAAVFLTLLLVRPRTAAAGLATCLAVGLAVLVPLAWMTDGGFVRHVFLYNINRFDFARLGALLVILAQNGAFVAAALVGVAKATATDRQRLLPSDPRKGFAHRQGDVCLLLLLIYLAFAAAMSLTIAKIGSNVNYAIEAMCVIAILVGVACRDAAEALVARSGMEGANGLLLRVALPAVLAVQALTVPRPPNLEVQEPRLTQVRGLVQMIHDARRPVISDDMVLVKRAGRQVVWEPAIFAELASKGLWDERPFIARVRRGEFAFFVTRGDRGLPIFDRRYTSAVSDAMDAAYPVRRQVVGYVLHLPKDGLAPR